MTKLILAVCVLALLAGCGKRGNPSPPGPKTDITYPKTYPTF